jgi:hypothetical protein
MIFPSKGLNYFRQNEIAAFLHSDKMLLTISKDFLFALMGHSADNFRYVCHSSHVAFFIPTVVVFPLLQGARINSKAR